MPLVNTLILGNIAINHILPKTGFFRLHYCHRQYGYTFNHFDVLGFES